MRFIALLTKNNNSKATFSETDNGYTIYDNTLYKKYNIMTQTYNTDMQLQKNYRKIVSLVHPFEIIGSTIKSSFIDSDEDIKITNAFMKQWEMLLWIEQRYNKIFDNKTLTMYDVAGAPGMFVLGTESFIKYYNKNIKLDWHACSLEGGTALQDIYKLYENNPKRYTPCDVLNKEDITKCIKEQNDKKFMLVTGDIGIYHEDDYKKLQEENQLNLEWGQMVLALNLVKEGGVCLLKMYSMVTLETVYLLDTLINYFEEVYITKPYCTRIFNDESYIICINRNNKDCSKVPYVRPFLKTYESNNISLVRSFEYSRLDIKYRMIYLAKDLIKDDPRGRIYTFMSNPSYNAYFKEFESLWKLFSEINTLWK